MWFGILRIFVKRKFGIIIGSVSARSRSPKIGKLFPLNNFTSNWAIVCLIWCMNMYYQKEVLDCKWSSWMQCQSYLDSIYENGFCSITSILIDILLHNLVYVYGWLKMGSMSARSRSSWREIGKWFAVYKSWFSFSELRVWGFPPCSRA